MDRARIHHGRHINFYGSAVSTAPTGADAHVRCRSTEPGGARSTPTTVNECAVHLAVADTHTN
jgi:hypothetical protein